MSIQDKVSRLSKDEKEKEETRNRQMLSQSEEEREHKEQRKNQVNAAIVFLENNILPILGEFSRLHSGDSTTEFGVEIDPEFHFAQLHFAWCIQDFTSEVTRLEEGPAYTPDRIEASYGPPVRLTQLKCHRQAVCVYSDGTVQYLGAIKFGEYHGVMQGRHQTSGPRTVLLSQDFKNDQKLIERIEELLADVLHNQEFKPHAPHFPLRYVSSVEHIPTIKELLSMPDLKMRPTTKDRIIFEDWTTR